MYRKFWMVDNLSIFLFVSFFTFPRYLAFSEVRVFVVLGHRILTMSQAQKMCSITVQCWQHPSQQKPPSLLHYDFFMSWGRIGGWVSRSVHTTYFLLNSYITVPYNEWALACHIPFVESFWLFPRGRISWTKCVNRSKVYIVSYISSPSNLI